MARSEQTHVYQRESHLVGSQRHKESCVRHATVDMPALPPLAHCRHSLTQCLHDFQVAQAKVAFFPSRKVPRGFLFPLALPHLSQLHCEFMEKLCECELM